MIDVLQWIATGLLGISVLLLLGILAKHDRVIRSMAQALADTARLSTALANAEIVRALRQPLAYCSTHGGQEPNASGGCSRCAP